MVFSLSIRSSAISSFVLFNHAGSHFMISRRFVTTWRSDASRKIERQRERERGGGGIYGNYYGLKNRDILRSVKHSPFRTRNPPLLVPWQWVGPTRCPKCQLALVSYGWPCRLARYFPPLLSSRYLRKGCLSNVNCQRWSIFAVTITFPFLHFCLYILCKVDFL